MGSPFYREAGPKDAPTILLLHGLPSSSRMFEPLFARLSDRYHLVAPDYPGFGHSDWPDPKKFVYTFDHIAEITNHFTEALGLSHYTLYMQDYGGPVGFRMHLRTRTASKPSSFRMRSRTTKVWARIGKRDASFGKIARLTKVRFAQISCRCRRRERVMSGTIQTWIVTIPIFGPMNSLFSISRGRRRFKAICSTIIEPMWTPIRNGRHGCGRSSRGYSSFGESTTSHSTQANRSAIERMCRTRKFRFSMPAILHWTRRQMKSPH
jgi:alpha/beta hydrolase fold